MAKRTVAPAVLAELEATQQNIHMAKDAEEKHNQVEITSSIRDNKSRHIYKNIKVTRDVEKKILAIKDARKDRGVKGVTFDSLVYEAILEFIDNHFDKEVID